MDQIIHDVHKSANIKKKMKFSQVDMFSKFKQKSVKTENKEHVEYYNYFIVR